MLFWGIFLAKLLRLAGRGGCGSASAVDTNAAAAMTTVERLGNNIVKVHNRFDDGEAGMAEDDFL